MTGNLKFIVIAFMGFIILTMGVVGIGKHKIQKRSQPELGDIDDLKPLETDLLEMREMSSFDDVSRAPIVETIVQERKPEIISISLFADEDKSYQGYDLLQALLSSGMRFGDMNIFHRFRDPNRMQGVIFSMASATEPGNFDIRDMGKMSTQGLTFFMRSVGQTNELQNFETMLETIAQLSHDLGGVVVNDRKQQLTESDILDYKSRILGDE